MKALEISLHGVLWLAGTAIAFFMCHRINDIELLVNLFFRKCDMAESFGGFLKLTFPNKYFLFP